MLLFLMHPLVVALHAPSYPLQDPGTGWHLAIGHHLVETGVLPRQDLFSFTARGHDWVSNYWLFEVVSALLVDLGGLSLYTAVWVLVYALLPVLLFRRMLRLGAGLLPALVLTQLAYLVLWSHALARSHILTYLFFALLLERLDDYRSGRLPWQGLWWLPLLAIVWCNVHGGFFAGLMLVGVFAAVATVRAVLAGDRAEGRQAAVFGALLAAMLLATLVNPRGAELHTSILATLGQESVRYLLDWASPDFLTPTMPVFFFEVLVLMTVGLLALRARRVVWVEVALLVFFLHEALRSVRHMSLFAIVAAPIIAREVTPLLASVWPAFDARCRRIAAEQLALRSPLLYLPAICGVFLWLAIARVLPFPDTLDGLQLSREAATFIATHEDRFRRMFNTDDLGGSLVYRFWPRLHIFVDDRVPVYGDEFVLKRYLPVYFGKKRWRTILSKYRVTSAVLSSSAPCVSVFREARDWQLVFEDRLNVIFWQVAAATPTVR